MLNLGNPIRIIGLCLAAAGVTAASTTFTTVDFSSQANLRMQTDLYPGSDKAEFPDGNVILGGVPFAIPETGNNAWNAYVAGGSNPRVLTLSLAPAPIVSNAVIYSLLNMYWGDPYATLPFASIQAKNSLGQTAVFDLQSNRDVRDYLYNTYANDITAPTTQNVFTSSSGNVPQQTVRLDMVTFALPTSWAGTSLVEIKYSDSGADNVQRLQVEGVTVGVEAVPEPGTTALLLAGALAMAGWRRMRRV